MLDWKMQGQDDQGGPQPPPWKEGDPEPKHDNPDDEYEEQAD